MPLLSKVLKMPVIKNEDYLEIKAENLQKIKGKELLDPIIKDAEQEAMSIIEKAKRQAEKEAAALLAKTKDECQKRQEETKSFGYQKGYQQGYQDGMKKAELEAQKIYDQQKNVLHEIYKIRDQIAKETEDQLVKLAIGISEKIIAKEINLHPETVVDIVKEALQHFRQAEQITIFANQEDLKILKQHRKSLLEIIGEHTKLYLVANNSIDRGNCQLESEKGLLDAKLKTQLKKIGLKLQGVEP
jgi:flagellar assembly protein FliH